ncbi:hypothetical protein SNE40_000504 [Patella caerulea]|uniref:Chitin-binding type-2 domain-containing protein n=1 Tax=Patella caerulea TaxID=87958 RepID=A0AAN8Q2B8_PATCE
MKLFIVVIALVAFQWQGSSAITCSYSCRKSYRTYGRCGVLGFSRCSSIAYRTDTCYRPCPVDGGWTDFTEWKEIKECDSLCGGGIKKEKRDRTCTDPAPAYGGDDCDGELSQVRNVACNTELCGDRCPLGQVKYIAHDGNKNKFYQCDNGVARLRDCAVGTMWSQDYTTCIHMP